jgi:flagellin
MGISINTNVAATRAGMYLGTNHANLQKSLDRLSSGKRITEPADDAGGLAVSMKLEHTGKVLQGVSRNIANATSLLQVQDGVLQSAGEIYSRIGELKAMYDDVTKNTADKDNYESELTDLQGQLTALSITQFNGVGLFDQTLVAADSLRVFLDETGTTTASMDWTNHDLAGHADLTPVSGGAGFATGEIAQADITTALERIATLRATNGGEVRRLEYAQANVGSQITNLSAAHGRIMDVDIAAESSNLAKQQILVQASAAMTAQANMSNDVALMLLRQ